MPNTSLMSPPKWYVPRISAVSPTGAEVALAVGEVVDLSVEVEPWQTVPAEQQWQRRGQPVLSTTLTTQDWSQVMLYMPGVIRADGMYKMWVRRHVRPAAASQLPSGLRYLAGRHTLGGVSRQPHHHR